MQQTTSRHRKTISEQTKIVAHPLTALALGLVLLLGFAVPLPAQETGSQSYSTRYATIYYGKAEDLYRFTRNIGSGISFLGESQKRNPLLAKKRVDKIVEKVMELLDMHPADLHFKVYVYRSAFDVETAYRRLDMEGPVPNAFYAHLSRSITVSLDTINGGMLAHEIAHAVLCAYFGTPPPRRMQEVLAQYVDRHLE